MTDQEAARLKIIEDKIRQYPILAVPYLQISTKDSRRIFLKPKRAQRKILRELSLHRNNYFLKYRQLGCTTLLQAVNYLLTITTPNTNTLLVAHLKDVAEMILQTTLNFYLWSPQSFPPSLIPTIGEHGKHKQGHLYFENLNSRIWIETAESDNIGIARTVQNLHLSEVSSYHGKDIDLVIARLMQGIPITGRKTLESTAKGSGNLAHRMWLDPDNGLNKVFLPWYLEEEYSYEDNEVFEQQTQGKIIYPSWENLKDDEKDVIKQAKKLEDIDVTLGQIAFRRQKLGELKEFFYQEYPEDDVSCFLVDSSNIFSAMKIHQLLRTIDDNPIDIMMDGHLRIYKYPEKGHSYVAGIDCSEGNINSDFSYTFVMDVETCEQVASLHGRFPDFIQAQKNVIIARFYNNCMLAIERNNHGHAIILAVQRVEGYDNLYYAEDEKAGWLTSSKTKPDMLVGGNGLAQAIEKDLIIIHEKAVLGECLTMEYKEGSKQRGFGAREGCYDDRVVGVSIALQARTAAMVPKDAYGQRLYVP